MILKHGNEPPVLTRERLEKSIFFYDHAEKRTKTNGTNYPERRYTETGLLTYREHAIQKREIERGVIAHFITGH